VFLLHKVKFEEIRKKLFIYIIIYNSLYIIIYEQFFLIFFNLTFCKKKDNAKIIILIIFLMFSHYYFSYIKHNLTKERRIYKHVWTYFVYNYICLYIFIHIPM